MTTTFSPVPAYIIGAACLSRGVMAILSPREEYAHVGLPLEGLQTSATATATASAAEPGAAVGTASPAMHFKGIREISYGAMFMALQHQGHEDALTTFTAILSVMRFGDGLVVWRNGGDKLRYRAWGHWITGLGYLGWVLWRWRR